jgi:amino-acid N-acetyltransferase
MSSKVRHAIAACTAGVPRVHVINGTLDQGLLGEVFSNHGLGTLIYANEYENIRPARKKDVRAIQLLTKQAVASDELMKRTKAMIEKDLADYFIFEIDKNIVACVALHEYPEQNLGELASLYVSPSHENEGIGRKLIQFIEDRARERGLASCWCCPRRRSRTFKPRVDSSKEHPTICRPRAARSTTRAAASPRCSSRI